MASWIQAENSQINLPFAFTSSSAEETFALGCRLACRLKNGTIVALNGALGAGKTCFVKGIARGLGVKEEPTSPAYTIISQYTGNNTPVYHIDVYRLSGIEDFHAIGGEETIFGDGISLIEWAQRIESIIPDEAVRVDIEIIGDDTRLIRIYTGKFFNGGTLEP